MSLRYGAWVVKQVVRLRDGGALAVKKINAAEAGERERPLDLLCPLCKQKHVNAEPIKWPSCGEAAHVCCESCMWKHASRDFNPMDNYEPILHCPMCPSTKSTASEAHCSFSQTAITKEASLALFKAMPEELPNKPKKLKFRAMSKAQLRSFSMGYIRSKRLQNWWRAASDGNYIRLCALMEAGIDVDAKDENGETALLVAQSASHSLEKQLLTASKDEAHTTLANAKRCLNNYRETVSFLLALGADPTIVSNAGCTVSSLRAQFASWKSSVNQQTNQHQSLSLLDCSCH